MCCAEFSEYSFPHNTISLITERYNAASVPSKMAGIPVVHRVHEWNSSHTYLTLSRFAAGKGVWIYSESSIGSLYYILGIRSLPMLFIALENEFCCDRHRTVRSGHIGLDSKAPVVVALFVEFHYPSHSDAIDDSIAAHCHTFFSRFLLTRLLPTTRGPAKLGDRCRPAFSSCNISLSISSVARRWCWCPLLPQLHMGVTEPTLRTLAHTHRSNRGIMKMRDRIETIRVRGGMTDRDRDSERWRGDKCDRTSIESLVRWVRNSLDKRCARHNRCWTLFFIYTGGIVAHRISTCLLFWACIDHRFVWQRRCVPGQVCG